MNVYIKILLNKYNTYIALHREKLFDNTVTRQLNLITR